MEKSVVKISVIMPSLNVKSYIAECIESALNQTLKDIEIICVDAGSTDGTLEILEEYERKYNNVKLLHSDVKSYGHQMNMGFDAAEGKYMAILETDDYIEKDMYEVLYNIAEINSLDFVKGDYEIFLGDDNDRTFTYMNTCKTKRQYGKIINPKDNIDIFNARMNTWTGIYNIDFLKKNNIRHNETLGASYQDNGFWFQTFMFASKIMFVEKAFYKLRRDNPNSSVHSRGKVFCIFDEYDYIEKILRSDKKLEKTFVKIFHKKKFDNCQYHYSRIGDEFKIEFMERMRKDFSIANKNNEIDPRVFVGFGYYDLMDIINMNNDIYHSLNADATIDEKIKYLENEVIKYKNKLRKIEHSSSYKLSKKLAFIPQKIRGGIKCYYDNGLKYTVNHLLKKLLK